MHANKTGNTKPLRAAIAAFIGTTIEWYDFYIYGLAAALVFGKLFFPPSLNPGISTLLAFFTLWAGFIARPLGGIIFGHFGDRLGRKASLIVTLLLMGCATTGIGLLPSYEQIGLWAPGLLLGLRVLQGISVGGEWGGAVLIASEHAPRHKRLFYAAFAQQGSPAGNVLATLVFFALSHLPMTDFTRWGWRIPFLLSALLIIVGLIIRTRIEEPPAMQRVIAHQTIERVPLLTVIRKHSILLLICALIPTVTHTIYLQTTFALSWATSELGYSREPFLQILLLSLLTGFIVQPFGAILVSRLNQHKAMLWILLPELLLMPLMFWAISMENLTLAAITMCLTTIPLALFYGAIGGLLAQAFPVQVRYTGMSFSYQLCATLVGGGTPMLAQWLLYTTGSIIGVAILAPLYVLVSLFSTLQLLNRLHTAKPA